jgi:tRNA(fMet)-specific endonuclease VapC
VARDYVIDTNIASYWFDEHAPQHALVKSHLERIPRQSLFFSLFSLGEVEYGHRANPGFADKQQAYAAFLQERFVLLGLEPGTTEEYGKIRAALFDKFGQGPKRKPGRRPEQLVDPETALSLGVQENDLWIAAQALAHDLTLVTGDRMEHIRKVAPDLVVEDWATST